MWNFRFSKEIIQLEEYSDIENEHLLIANLEANGYYKVNYDAGNWEKIINQLNKNSQVRIRK